MIRTRRIRWEGIAACMGEKRNACRFFGGKARRKEATRRTQT
jgi:hypothetical protein